MSWKKVAVIIVNFNGVNDTIECINSLFRSKLNDTLEIIVVDNASKTDEALRIKEKYPNICTIRSDVNGGFSAGNNIGIKYALEKGADYIMLLNNDTVIAPDMISFLLRYCEDSVVAVPKMLYYSEPDKIWYGGGRINRWTGNAVHLRMNEKDDKSEDNRFCSFATGCCMMFKSETLKTLGLLNEHYFMYFEDVEFCVRMASKSIRILYVPDAKLWHKVGSSSGGNCSPFSTYYITRNRLNCIKENKKFFHFTSYWFSLITRYVRMLQYKNLDVKQALRKGLKDYFQHRDGMQSCL